MLVIKTRSVRTNDPAKTSIMMSYFLHPIPAILSAPDTPYFFPQVDYVTHPFFQHEVCVRDFVRRCLTFDESARLTVQQALAHPLLQSYLQQGLRDMKWADFPADRSVLGTSK